MDFLRELWEEKAKRERGEVEKYPDIFVWREAVKEKKNASLNTMLNLLSYQIARYVETIKRRQAALARFDREGKNEDTTEELVSTDQLQRMAHESLISQITAFVRSCAKKGIQIDIDLESIKNSRDASRDWAIKNADIAKKILEAEKEK